MMHHPDPCQGSVVMLALAVATKLFKYIPKAALASIIFVSVLKMVKYRAVIKFWKVRCYSVATICGRLMTN